SSMSSGNLQSQIAEYNKILLERNRMLANSSENHPLVKDQTKHLNAMQSVILQSVNNEIASLSMQIKNVNAQESRTERQLARNPNQAKYLLSEERQQKVMEGLYLFLLQKREENALSQAFTAYNTRLITEPRGSNSPAAPNRSVIWMFAIVAGLLLPATVMFLIEMCNTTIRGRQDVERLAVPFAGEIPQCTKKEGNTENGITLVVKESCRNIINEAFRVVRTNVDFMLGKGKTHKVVMFTSLNPGSGKSFVSANLAYCMSLKKKKVVAVDLDLRRASLSQVVDRPHHGVVDYLNGDRKSWKDVLVHIEDSTFDVIPVGEIPPNPTELLFNEDYLPRMIEELKQEYDYVFIDCPPVDVVADANVVSEYVDMALFVVRAGLMKKDMLPIVDTFYNQKKFPSLSLILNGTSVTKTMGTKYGYGYGYGYGNYIKE
ncbi:MAG: polysaccharide biosynthesis tyrosine autokinase, partial [Paludibacteraceae bacterium]|nr:polysaccharide biosynthesis tyrosine autokinase [Paludibacteraceae bacterium]